MGIFKKNNKYIKCKPSEDKTGVRCASYLPDKDGNQKIIATADFNRNPDGTIDTLSHDGDPEEIENLTLHALKYNKRGKANNGEF